MWLGLTLVSFVVFLACAFALTRLGFDANGKWQSAGVPLACGLALSLGLWVFSLSRVPPPYPLDTLKRYQAPPIITPSDR